MVDPKDQRQNDLGVHLSRGKELYYDTVGDRLRNRAGADILIQNGKGVAQEIMFKDRLNGRPEAIFRGERATLTHRTARVNDIVVTRHGKVVKKFQVKDTPSISGVQNTISRVRKGQYHRTSLAGSPETVVQYAKAGGQSIKPMSSTGISSNTSTRVAANAGANVCQTQSAQVSRAIAGDILTATQDAAVVSAGLTVALGLVSAIQDIQSGTEPSKAAADLVFDTASAAAASAVKTAGALGLKEGARTVAQATANQTLKKFVGSNPGTAVAFALADQAVDTLQFVSGHLTNEQYVERTCTNVGSTGGAIIGAQIGTAVFPGIGTIVGGAIGAILGGVLGERVTKLY